MAGNINAITTKLPSYLQILLQDNYNIELVYQQRSEVGELQIHEVKSEANLYDANSTDLELTGTPLAVDLGGDDSVCRETDMIFIQPPSWSTEEAKCYPISLSEARNFVNERLQLQKSNGSKPMIAICDASDSLNTAILGDSKAGNKLTRIVAYILKCHSEENEITTFQYMKKDHISNVTRDAQISYLVTKYYYLRAYDLRNCVSLASNPTNGSVAVEVSSNQIATKSQKNANFKIILQVIVGHPNSPINSVWEELCVLQSYINILASTRQLCETTVISDEYLDSMEVESIISDLLAHNIKHLKKKANKALNLEDLRDENIYDKLYSVLKKCRDLLQLRDTVQLFFEQLADTEDLQNIYSEENSIISDIVTGILAGTVPTLNFSQSLELFIDVGLEKLKKDYLVIIGNFYPFTKDVVSAKWRTFNSENVARPDKHSKRKSRLTINSKSVLANVTSSKLKLSYLDSMHKVAELMLLSKDNLNISEEGCDHFYEVVANKFINSEQIVPQVDDIKKPRLCEFSLNSFPTDGNIIKELSPVAWTVKMMSTLGNSETTTVFHFSDHPIFPPSIFSAYDISFNNSELKTVYVTKLVKLVHRLGF